MSISIKDVARAAGVSLATVSRVLSNGSVSAATRRKVEDAVKATGYHPNLSARRLRSQDSQTIGLIVSDLRNPFFTAVSRAVEDAAYQAGMRVILCNTDENPEREAMYLRLMQEERVSGIIFAPTSVTLDRLDSTTMDVPVVLIDRAGPPGLYDSVLLDNAAACALLVDHLHDQGYRSIGGLFGNTSTTGAERHQGYKAAMQAHWLPTNARFIAPTAEAAEAETLRWLDQPDRPEAIIASNGQFLLGVARAARKTGLAMPKDLALAGFDNESWTELVGPGLTVIEQPVYDIGKTAMSLLFDRLSDPGLPVRKMVLSGRCIIRGSSERHP